MSSATEPLWAVSDPALESAPLAADVTCDVCVVGAGIAGLTAAYLLAKEGKRVVVLDAKPTASAGETAHTTAHLAWYIDDQFSHLASARGDEVAKLAAASHRAAIDLIEQTAKAEPIACDFERVEGVLFPGSDGPKTLHEEAKALTRLGLPFELKPFTFPGGQTVDTLRFPAHGRFHPTKYTAGLAKAIRARGGVIHPHTVAEKVSGGSPCTVTTTHKHTVTAAAVVAAANNPFEGGTVLHTKVAAYTTYAIALELPQGDTPPDLFWDTEDPYHYVRTHPGEGGTDVLVVGGEDHKTGQASDQQTRWANLEAWTRARFPQAGPVRRHWSGQVFETSDGLALIGLAPWNGPNVYVITGDSGMGMTHSTLGGRLVADLVLGRPNELAAVYSPSRQMGGALLDRLGETANMAAQFVDWVTGGDVKDASQIPPGHGGIVRRGLTKLAMYKDDAGAVTTLSAVCPHMGCIVRWNPGESTWDCPCHGSRFAATGTCLHGPSTADLAKAE